MGERDQESRQRILAATIDILNEIDDPARITVRQIAERAGVGIGAINYHFQSKDNLVIQAVNHIVEGAAANWYEPLQHTDVDAVTRLKRLIKDTASAVARYDKFMRITISYGLLQGEMDTSALILPLLREIVGGDMSESELRVLAFQLIIPTQVAYLRADAFKGFTGVDLYDESQRDAMLDLMVDHLIRKHS